MVKALRNIALGGLGIVFGVAGVYALTILLGVVPGQYTDLLNPARAACVVTEMAKVQFFKPAARPHDNIRVLVARLDGDADGQVTRRVVHALEGVSVLEPQAQCRTIRASADGAPAQAQAWAAAGQAGMTVFGERDRANGVIRLAIAKPATSTSALTSFDLDARTLVLPEALTGDLGAAVLALVLTQAGPELTPEQSGQLLEKEMLPLADRLEILLADPLHELSAEAAARLQLVYSDIASTIGKQTGRAAWFSKSVTANRLALLEFTRARSPLSWAGIQNNLGLALQNQGEWQGDADLLDEAIAAYRAALTEATRARAPLGWAEIQNNLGSALGLLGARRGDQKLMEDAVIAFREALKERTREQTPLAWADTQNNLGNALGRLGTGRKDEKLLDAAAAAFRESLSERTRARAPLDWAGTQSNLGIILGVLGERRDDQNILEEAAAAFRAACLERTRERAPAGWAVTQNNLGLVLASLGMRRKDPKLLEEAVVAFEGAIEVYQAMGAVGYLKATEETRAGVQALHDNLKAQASAPGPAGP